MMNAMDSPPQRQLLQQAEKVLLRPIHSHLVAYCPSMDLIALVTDEENLDVYRINGQRALGLKRKSEDVTVQALCWQWNGAGIAVAWSDGCVDVVSVETGKVVHRNVKVPFEGADEEGTRVGVIGWGLNFIDAEKVKRRTGELKMNDREYEGREEGGFRVDSTEDWDDFKDELSLEDFLQRQPDFSTLDIAPDLPDQLAMMDTESLLPKLPAIPLPPANPLMRFQRQAVDAGAFSTQVQVDGLLHSHHLRDYNGVDMFIRCTEKGSIYPSIYDSMETVDVRLPAAWGVKSKISSSSSGGDNQKKLAWVPLTLGFIPSAGNYLHLIASKTAQLQNLLSYLSHALTRIQAYFIQSQDLPGKFMRNISETLEEHKQGDLVQNLYHLACTGHCPQVIHDWLVDELAEQGHKRWDNATSSGLTLVIQILHENLLPALDRCSIIISRLRGLATYHDRDWIFSGPVSDFTALFGVLKTLRVLANTTLLYATDEKRYFTSFSKWLRYSIDFEATEPGSQSRTEMEARDPGVDVAVVLQYIEHGMANSDVAPYLQSAKAFEGVEPCEYEETLKAIELLREGAAYKPEALCVEKVLEQFGERVRGLLKQVSQWQENNITMDSGLVLEEGKDIQALDMRMVAETDQDTISTYVALRSPSSPSSLNIHSLTHAPHISSLASSLSSSASLTLQTSKHTLLEAKFADDTTLLLLLQHSSSKTCCLVSLPYASTKPSPLLSYAPLPDPELRSTLLPDGYAMSHTSRRTLTLSEETLEAHTRHVFEGRFTPLKLVVNGRKGRRVVVVLGSDKKHYRVLDLDFRERKKKQGSAKGDGDDNDEAWSDVSDGLEGSDVEMESAM